MSDKQPMQASGQDGDEGAPDGVETPNDQHADGQSNGGAYPNPNGPDNEKTGGFLGHGGQSHIDYSGPGDKDDPGANSNAATGAD
ncbi:MAG: hypothetical protein EOP68_08020 [Sphingomonas sp.]|jgi:hypothetical protein|nr:MAG: hypothetical protein EOP68_08020 [Sphingomonas sp.]